MKKIFRNTIMGVVACCTMATSSCTDLNETLYDQLNDMNVDMTDENNLSLMLGAAVAQYRYLVEDWFGMFHLIEESTDQYMVPARPGVGWGDAYINLHKHNWGTEVGQIQNPWDIAYRGISYCNIVLDSMPEDNLEGQAQARFFRAMFYYHLMDMFGNVPLQTTQQVEPGYLPTQPGVDKVYEFLELYNEFRKTNA